MNVEDVRCEFAELRDKAGQHEAEALEIVGACFEADEPSIFGKPDKNYIAREISWYESQSLNVYDMAGKVPKVWEEVSSDEGIVNSNYGYLLFSHGNGDQFAHVVDELNRDVWSRRAVAVYTRPTIHFESKFHGMQDFICTNAVQYLVRNGKVNAVVQMRSNDVVYGYKNDYAWQKYALKAVVDALVKHPKLKPGKIYWQVGSLHIYRRHFYLIDEWVKNHA